MKVTNEKIENRQAFLSIEMEPAEVEESLEKSYHRLVKKMNIPGFRKGKAPRAVVERHLSRESLLEEALGELIPKAYEEAIKEQKLDAIARPQIEVTQTDPVVFKAVVPLRPTVELNDCQSIRVSSEPVEVPKEDDVNAIIERLRHQHATWEPVERPTGFNDMIVLDIESNIEDKPFISQKGAQYLVVQNQPFPAPGFAEQLVGMKRDEEKEFQLQFPLDYPKGELAGKKASFKVKVIEIKQEKLPKLNSEFAKGINPDFKTLNSLRKHILSNLKLRAKEKARIDFEDKVLEAAAETSQVEFPPILAEREIDRLLNQRLRRWQAGGNNLEEYLSSINKTEEEIREELRPLATKRTTWALVLGEIAEQEKIKVSNSAINTEIKNMIKGAAEDKKSEINKFLNTPESRKSIEQSLLTRKTIERLVKIAKGSGAKTATSGGESLAKSSKIKQEEQK